MPRVTQQSQPSPQGHLAGVHAPNCPTSLKSLVLPTLKKQTPKLGASFYSFGL